jgi:hypothetical protein
MPAFERHARIRREAHDGAAIGRGRRIAFVIGHPQDYHQLMPLVDATPAARRTIVLRQGAGTPAALARRAAIAATLHARGYRTVLATSTSDVDWNSLDALVVASESTANGEHLLNAAFVIAARTRGVRTFQLQHGIVPLADFDSPVFWFAEHFLAWSTDVRRAIRGRRDASARAVFQPVDTMRYTVTGCPKFDGYASAARPTALQLFGDRAQGFDRCVLLATNLQWQQHRTGESVWPVLRNLIARSPRDLFIVKLHPLEEPPPELVAGMANAIVIDELTVLATGIDTTDLVLASDVVVCTLSTIALEAALGGKPFFVLDTGNPNRYRSVRPIEPGRLGDALSARPQALRGARTFIGNYLDASTVGRATNRVLDTIARDVERERAGKARRSSRAIDARLRVQRLDALAALAMQRDAEAAALRAAGLEMERYLKSMESVLAEKDRYILSLIERLKRGRRQSPPTT